MQYGYTLSSEEHHPNQLVERAKVAEERGFDFLSISDHFHPWVDAQGHSAFVWSALGGIATVTDRIEVGIGVTCPILRIHPAIVAHAAATTAAMMGDRFFLGIGTGEQLNEHVLGQKWPRIEIRQEMLAEAIDVMRALWTGEVTDFDGLYFDVENARIYTLPDTPPPIVMSAFGTESAKIAAEKDCGLWINKPDRDVVDAYKSAGGTGPVVGQLSLCWAENKDAGVDTVYEQWPTKGLSGQLSQELATPALFEMACETVTRDDIADGLLAGPDAAAVRDGVAEFADAGFDRLHLHQIGPDQDGFFEFWSKELQGSF